MDKYTIAPPAGSTNNSVGASDRPWQEGYFNSVKLNGGDVGTYLAESTGFGIISGCEPTISGLTVTVGAGVMHLADGTRKELSASTVTLDAADSTNPRIDLVYIDSTGVVAKITGTAAASPSAPSVPTGGISVAQVRVAAGATTGTVAEIRRFINNSQSNKIKLGINCKSYNITSAQAQILAQTYSYVRIAAPTSLSDFTQYDNQIDVLSKAGLMPLVILGLPPQTDSQSTQKFTDETYTAYATYISGIVTHYVNRGYRGIMWEIGNEPDRAAFQTVFTAAQYVRLVQTACSVIKAIDSTAVIIAPGTTGIPSQSYFLQEALSGGLLNYTDVFSVHSYQFSNFADYDEYIKSLRSIVALVRSYSDVPIYITESGYSTVDVSDTNRGYYLVRNILLFLLSGIDSTFIYCDVTAESSSSDRDQWFGIYNSDYSSKTSATAITNFISSLADYIYEGAVYYTQNAVVIRFVNAELNYKYIGVATGDTVVSINGVSFNLSTNPQFLSIPFNTALVSVNNIGAGVPCGNGAEIFNNDSNRAFGQNSHAEGFECVADGTCSHAEGEKSAASQYSHAEGSSNFALGANSAITAYDTSNNSITLSYVTPFNAGDDVWLVGWNDSRTATTSRRNKIVSLSGNVATMLNPVDNYQYCALINNGYGNHAEGQGNIVAGNYSHAEGYVNGALGTSIHVGGTKSEGTQWGAFAHGQGVKANSQWRTVFGKYNSTANTAAFEIGNGTDDNTRSNAFRVTYEGAVYGLSAYNSGGADYAEYFEWVDSNISNEDRVGYFVTLDNDKIRIAKSTDTYILGIVSGNASVIGNSYNDQWQDMYVTDDFGRIQYEDVEVEDVTDSEGNIIIPAHKETRMKINPDYDNTQEYVGREKRKEWSAVGMLGVLPVRDDGTCEVNGYCKVADGGIATKTTSGYRVIERVSENVVKIVFR